MTSRDDAVASAVSLSGVSFAYVNPRDYVYVIDDISLEVERSSIACLVGPSGCGKTTLFRLIVGRLAPQLGQVSVNGVPTTTGSGRPGTAHSIGYMTQDDLLLPWMTAIDNAALGLRLSGVDRAERYRRAASLLDRLGLAGFEDAYPKHLSGGMRQRVALARTLLPEPTVLLLDEPFSRLDAQTRIGLEDGVLDIQRSHDATILFITHDIEEAISIADNIYVLSARPMRVVKKHEISIDRTDGVIGARRDQRFGEYLSSIWKDLESFRERSSGLSDEDREGNDYEG